MTTPFTHLHVHTQYSMLDGAIRVSDLIEKTQQFGMDAVAITDHGAMYGALEFYVKAKKAGIKPLVGCEFYLAENGMHLHNRSGGHNFHLVALAMNETGYRNLMKLASLAQTKGFYYRPRIDCQTLYQHNEGLIILTACLKGEIPWRLTHNDPAGARNRALEMQKIFGDRLYLEIQENGLPEQTIANEGLMALADELGIKLVATNDCHYLTQEESYAHEVLLCIQTGRTIDDPNRFRFNTNQLFFKSGDEMAAQFGYCPQALSNTLEVAERCDLHLKLGESHFPIFPVKKGETLDSVFAQTCWDGLKERLDDMHELEPVGVETEKIYRERLTHEIDVIQKMGFSGYFLIVADFINWAKQQKIPVGPGRGSGAGSLAAYCLQITNIDPIPYGLLFERFLNIERMSMPDFDIDFCKDRRDEVLDYVRQRYGGDEHVAQIVAYGSMKARAVLRDVGRVLDIPLPVVDRIAKLVPDELKITLKKAIEKEPRLREAMKEDGVRELLTISRTLEGLSRHKSTHAAGVVISPQPMVEYLPVCIGPNKEILTQYDMKYTEKTGLIKFDFLGLKTLTVIDRALKLITCDLNIEVDLHKIPMNDPKTYALLCRGDSLGVFQLESDGMRELLIKMQPEQFSDLIALVALYRPGPLDSGMVDTFVDTKHGRRPADYPLPQIKSVLQETYGVIVYQEQVMKISNILAGYSLGDADILRRAMGKKIAEVMEKERGKFMAGAAKNNIPEAKAKHIFDLMAKFAGYGFNKSHSAAYALIAYQTAYLKAHYPAQFLAALLSCDVENTDKVVKYINECRQEKIEVLPPDINESFNDFTVVNDRIRFGLAAVKNVGGAALDSIFAERTAGGNYHSLADFCSRIDSAKVNRKVIESLIKAGAFDSLNPNRKQYMEVLDQCIDRAKAVQRDRLSGQMNLFAIGQSSALPSGGNIEMELPVVEDWPQLEKLAYEKEMVGFFLTGHPLEGVLEDLRRVVDTDIVGVEKLRDGQVVRIGGLMAGYKEHKSKKGERMAFTVFEDMTASIEVIVFPSTFSQYSQFLTNDQPLIVLGTVQQGERGAKIVAQEILGLNKTLEQYTEKAVITLQSTNTSRQHMLELKELLYQYHGTTPVLLTLQFADRGEVDIQVLKDMSIRPTTDLFHKITRLCGRRSLVVQVGQPVLQQRRNGNSRNGYQAG
ncbi:DNA polymerase III subunit alpha [Desulfobulbus oligotrophicus]|uniref:DNA polymerase III subunit alpha n=1 Tax=Desulfobulbus oligotrophicus TaxID=1909699 RepID=A0A7T5VAM8_9BACT|nr:DNA polymerase III subunit alpha [Desulfobulbus oligotrophicus]MDY0391460.1 DNA polymerase III subunit alpha [Desulfobulbus oligotrophicus]QQG64354.1 DNA polymerase III subunit alpha [Desulfobulbus oligotrophicus]